MGVDPADDDVIGIAGDADEVIGAIANIRKALRNLFRRSRTVQLGAEQRQPRKVLVDYGTNDVHDEFPK